MGEAVGERGDHLRAGLARHEDVGDDQRDLGMPVEQRGGLERVGAGDGVVAEFLQRAGRRREHAGIVLHDKDVDAAARGGGREEVVDRGRRDGGAGVAWKVERHRGATARRGVDRDAAAMLADEGEDLAEAEARALARFLGGEEGLEDALGDLGRHAAAVVGDAERDVLARLAAADRLRFQHGRARHDADRAAAVDRVARVDREVEDDVLELDAVGADAPAVGAVLRDQGDAVAQRPVEQVRHVGDQRRGGDRLGLERFFAAEGEEAAGQRGGALGTLDRAFQVAACGGEVGAAPGEFETAQNDGQHIVEIVRDTAGQLADRVHLLHLAQLGFLGAEFRRRLGHRLRQRLDPLGGGVGVGARPLALVARAEQHPAEHNRADDEEDAEDGQNPRDAAGAVDRGSRGGVAAFEHGALTADDRIELVGDLDQRGGASALVEAGERLAVLAVAGGERGRRQFPPARVVGGAEAADRGIVRRIVVGDPVEPVDLRSGERPLLEVELAHPLVGGDDVAAERRLRLGDRARERARQDHHVIAVRLEAQRAVALAVGAAQSDDQRDEHGRGGERHQAERDRLPDADAARRFGVAPPLHDSDSILVGGSGEADAAQPITPTARPAARNMPMTRSICSGLCSAQSEQRSRKVPAGVAGGRAMLT